MKRYLAILLTAMMIFTLTPIATMADETEENNSEHAYNGLLATSQEQGDFTSSDLQTLYDYDDDDDDDDYDDYDDYDDDDYDYYDDDHECGKNLTWEFDNSTGTLTISGSGTMDDMVEGVPWYAYKKYVKKVVINNGVKNIGDYAFEYFVNMESVEIPSTVTRIGEEAFAMCSSLTSIVIPSKVDYIGAMAFYYCTSLKSINIPSSVTVISHESNCAIDEEYSSTPFEGCSSLKTITVASGNKYYDSRNSCNAIIDTKTNSLIVGCKNTTIPSTVKSIEKYAFYGCCLNAITIPTSVTSIGEEAFCGCSFNSVTIPSSVKKIGDCAFGYYDNPVYSDYDYDDDDYDDDDYDEEDYDDEDDYDEDASDYGIPGFTISGYSGSAAEIYATKNKFKFISKGFIAPKSISISKSSYTYTGKSIVPKVTIKNSQGNTVGSKYYTVKYSNNKNAGKAKITVTFKDVYKSCKALTKTFNITQATNPIKLKATLKTFKSKNLNKKGGAYTIAFKTKAQGKVTYSLSKAAKKAKIKVNSKGKITVPKKCKKGTYLVYITATGNSNYKYAKKIFQVIVK